MVYPRLCRRLCTWFDLRFSSGSLAIRRGRSSLVCGGDPALGKDDGFKVKSRRIP